MITWTIDGALVVMKEWDCSDSVPGGFDQFRGICAAKGLQAFQGSVITGYRTDTSVLWQGRLSEDPAVTRGEARIAANGWRAIVEKATQPMLYRHDGFELWTSADSDPHNYAANDIFETVLERGRWRVRVMKDETINVGNQSGIVFWAEGSTITRAECRSSIGSVLGSMTNYSVRFETATGPDGTLTSRGVDGLSTGTLTHSVTANADWGDLIRVQIERTASSGTSTHKLVTIDRPKIWGRTSSDTFSSSEVAADVAAELGLDPRLVQGSNDDILPLYWTDDSLAELLTYVADLADYRWLIREDDGLARGHAATSPILDFGPWDRVFFSSLARGVSDADFTHLEKFNRVRVNFQSVSGASRSREALANPDPLEGRQENIFDFELQDAQRTGDLADAVATRLLKYYASSRVRGRVILGEVQDSGGSFRSAYDLRAGDLLHIVDYDESVGPQRVVSVNYSSRGQVSAELNQDLNISRLMARAEDAARRARRRRRRNRRN